MDANTDGANQDIDTTITGSSRNKKRRTKQNSSNESKEEEKIVPNSEAVQYHCNYCRKDISQVVHIRCAVCSDFDLCVECFSVGVELSGHKNDHDYRIIDNMHFPFLDPNWGADEELLLLEGLEIHGMGNWEDVAEHVTTKTKEECEEHYTKYYLNSPCWPLPDLSHIFSTKEDVRRLNAGLGLKHDIGSVSDTTNKDKRTKAKKAVAPKPQPSAPVNSDLAGYMPMRGEFEAEYDNTAEFIIKDLSFDDDDTSEEREAKLKLLEIYNWKLDRRAERRKFVLERGLHDLKKQQALERKRTKEEREMYNKMRKFLQLMSNEDFEQFIKNLVIEKQLKERIQLLQKHRRLGIRTLTEGEAYEKEKRRRDLAAEKRIAKPESSLGLADGRERKGPGRKGVKRTAADLLRDPNMLDISSKPQIELLSERERELCSTLRLLPEQYIVIKETLLREYMKHGELKKSQARQMIKIDVNKTSKIFDFFEESGWINRSRNRARPQMFPTMPLPPNAVSQNLQPPMPASSLATINNVTFAPNPNG